MSISDAPEQMPRKCEAPPTPSQKVMSIPNISEQSELIVNKECDPPPTPSQKVMSDMKCYNESRDKPLPRLRNSTFPSQKVMSRPSMVHEPPPTSRKVMSISDAPDQTPRSTAGNANPHLLPVRK